MEAVNTNIIGAFNVCQVAAELGVEAVVDLSTDKAVEPVNAMGMTKALQERIVSSFSTGSTRFGVVRYGNVLASNGSVVPYFKRLLEEGSEVLPITDRRMTRFVLTLPDSVDLVLYAMRECGHGEIYVLDLPAFLISDVAEVMAERSRDAGHSVRIDEIGVRPGEKLHETLISSEEMRHATKKDQVWCVRPFASSEELFPPGSIEKRLSSETATRLDKQQIVQLLESQNCFPRLSPLLHTTGSVA
jgi:FlaA1/EpsC-like NDP-sugar epimerase